MAQIRDRFGGYDWPPWPGSKPTVDFKEEQGTVAIEVDCGDVGAIKVGRTSYDNKVAFFHRTEEGWDQIDLDGNPELAILAHTMVKAFVALNREGKPLPAPAGPFLTEPYRRSPHRRRCIQEFERGRPFNKPTVDFREEHPIVIEDATQPSSRPFFEPTVDFREENGVVVIEVDCGDDDGGVKVERSSYNEAAFLMRTSSDWQQVVQRDTPQLVILTHAFVEAFVALNREGIPLPAPAGPFLAAS